MCCERDLVAVYALEADPSAALALTICGFLLLVAYRAYASLSENHLSLGQLHHFTVSVTRTPELDKVMLAVLAPAKEILRAE